jgi:hypothetical protein
MAKFRHEPASGGSDRSHQVRLPVLEAFDQQLDERFFYVWLVTRRIQRYLVEIDQLSQPLCQRSLERGRMGRERGSVAPERVNDENPLSRPGGRGFGRVDAGADNA